MNSNGKVRLQGLTLIEALVVIVVIGIIAAIFIPGLLSSGRVSNERNASTSLRTLTSAEADFRANDRDWNHVNDFWTADVKGLYTMTSAAIPGAQGGPTDPPIKLIELSLAGADVDGAMPVAGGENMPLSNFTVPSPKAGYWYAALVTDLSAPPGIEITYRQDTGGTPRMGSCHNSTRFGFFAFPDSMSASKYVYIVNENNTVYRSAATGAVGSRKSNPPGLESLDPAYLQWPEEKVLKSRYTKQD
jgi:prepilin-type N-terminal cleavage/methylation domain-containing protein